MAGFNLNKKKHNYNTGENQACTIVQNEKPERNGNQLTPFRPPTVFYNSRHESHPAVD